MSAVPDPVPIADRFVVRPARWVVILLGLTVGPVGLGAAGLGVLMLTRGLAAGLIFVALGVFCLALLYATTGGTLRADQEWVRNTRLIDRGACRRDELASLRIVASGTRAGPLLQFVKKDGRVAFRTVVSVWGNRQLSALAGYLGVPLLHDEHPATHVCPVCGYPWLEEAAYVKGAGSGEICPCCGFDFIGAVDPGRHAEWRQQWISGGMSWWAAQAGRPAPDDWDPARQLKALLG